MADIERNTTFVRDSAATQSSGGGMALIVGGLVVAVGVLAYVFTGGSVPGTDAAPTISIETNSTAPAADPAPAPAEPAPAPAEPVTP